jgi:hypothetical protein
MPYSGRDPKARRCRATSKQTGEQCKATSYPFTDPPLCKAHGAYTPAVIEKARRAAERFESGWHSPMESPPSALERRIRIERYYEAEARYHRHVFKKQAKKYGWDVDEMDRIQQRLASEREQERARLRGAPQPRVWVGEPVYFEIEEF